jgi:hypothetical protein
MTLSSYYPRHDHAAAASVCHFGKHNRNFTSSTFKNTALSISTQVLSSPHRFKNKYPFQINKAAQKGNPTLAKHLLLEMHQEYHRMQNAKCCLPTTTFCLWNGVECVGQIRIKRGTPAPRIHFATNVATPRATPVGYQT